MNLDRESLLVEVDADRTLGEVEDVLAREKLTLGIANFEVHRATSMGAWLADGAPGAPDPWLDPADHLVAGLDATLEDGSILSIRPAPRRSTGPDLVALAFGARGRFMSVTRAWLRVHSTSVARPETEPFNGERNPPVSAEEETLLAAIAKELSSTPWS